MPAIDRIMDPSVGVAPATVVPASGYTGKKYDASKYEVDALSYPSGLMGDIDQYGGNYVMFYINVNNESKMLENPNMQTVGSVDMTQRDLGNLAGQNLSGGQVVGGVLGGSATIIGGGAIAGVTNAISNKNAGGRGGTIAGAIAGAGAAAAIPLASVGAVAASTGSSFSRSQKRLRAAIALTVPNQLSIKYSSDWGSEEMMMFQAGVSSFDAVSRALSTKGGSTSQPNENTISSLATAIALSKGPNAAALSSITGLAPNPMK